MDNSKMPFFESFEVNDIGVSRNGYQECHIFYFELSRFLQN